MSDPPGLRDCPFCDKESSYDYPMHGRGLSRAGCPKCGIWTPWRPLPESNVATLWNRRPA